MKATFGALTAALVFSVGLPASAAHWRQSFNPSEQTFKAFKRQDDDRAVEALVPVD